MNPNRFSGKLFTLDLVLNYTDKLLGFLRVQILLLLLLVYFKFAMKEIP